MSEKDLELKNEQNDSADENAELEEKAAKKFSAEKSYKKSELDEELEILAQTFRDELKKAQEEQGEEFFDDEDDIIPAEDLCECCCENRKSDAYGEGYPYCEDCRDAMSRYPFNWSSLLVTAVILVLSIVSVMTFFGDFDGYYAVYNAKKAYSERKLTTAVTQYEEAISIFDDDDINAKKIRLECADALYDSMPQGISSMNRIEDLISGAFSDFESNLIINKKYVDMRDRVMVMYGTMQKFYVVINNSEYADIEDDKVYEQAMTAIGKILDEQIEVKTIDGDSSNSYPADESIVRFCQFMFAYTAGKHDDSYKYMREVADKTPDYLWLYAYELGVVDSQSGDYKSAKALAEKIYSNNIEDYGSYCVYSGAERLAGNIDNAIEWADKGIENVPQNTEIRRCKAMALAMKGEYEEAEKVLGDALAIEENTLLSVTLLVVENELGKADTVKEMKGYFEENGIELPKRTQDYLNGKLTIEKLFGEGTGDIEE